MTPFSLSTWFSTRSVVMKGFIFLVCFIIGYVIFDYLSFIPTKISWMATDYRISRKQAEIDRVAKERDDLKRDRDAAIARATVSEKAALELQAKEAATTQALEALGRRGRDESARLQEIEREASNEARNTDRPVSAYERCLRLLTKYQSAGINVSDWNCDNYPR